MRFLSTQLTSHRKYLYARTRPCTRLQVFLSGKQITPQSIPLRGLATDVGQTVLSNRILGNTCGSRTMPPGHQGAIGHLRTFSLPETVTGTSFDRRLGKEMIDTWRKDGIFQVSMTPRQADVYEEALVESKDFFKQSQRWKASHVDSQSFAGYIASGEELTDGIADYSEIFTVTKDLPGSDRRVRAKWPCHGPCPWPSQGYKKAMGEMMTYLGENGEKLLQLAALGLGLSSDTLTQLTADGWHHMRILRFPKTDQVNGKGNVGRGIGSHTDYGLLVIACQDDIGGLFIRPPIHGETIRNWEKSAAGVNEDDNKWVYVPPVPGVFTVFPGDMMQYLTNSYLPSTPHKVGLNTAERFAFAYFHEPNFSTVVKPVPEYNPVGEVTNGIHYGTHFTNMFMRNYPRRITAERINQEKRMVILEEVARRDRERNCISCS